MKNSEPGCLLWCSVAGKEGKASQKSPRGSVVKYQNKLPKEFEDCILGDAEELPGHAWCWTPEQMMSRDPCPPLQCVLMCACTALLLLGVLPSTFITRGAAEVPRGADPVQPHAASPAEIPVRTHRHTHSEAQLPCAHRCLTPTLSLCC